MMLMGMLMLQKEIVDVCFFGGKQLEIKECVGGLFVVFLMLMLMCVIVSCQKFCMRLYVVVIMFYIVSFMVMIE